MRFIRSHSPPLISTLLLLIAIVCLYPYCKYYIDPDATAYLTIAQRYEAGNWQKAINGYWSPLSCWFVALLHHKDYLLWDTAIFINLCGAIGFLCISYSYFRLFNLRSVFQGALGCSLAIFLAYAVYKQSFADLWGCFFMLAILRIMLAELFFTRPALWVSIGMLGALAYYSKAYYFPFFILHTLVVGYFISRSLPEHNLRWLKMSFISIGTMVLCALPWMWLLHDKYGIWTTGTVGTLNTSWYLVGHPYWKADFNGLIPPPYKDSPYYWEDPYLANGDTPHFWSSDKLFVLQIIRIGYNILKFVNSMNALSCFIMVLWLVGVAIVLLKKWSGVAEWRLRAVCLSMLLFPLGFLLINYEPRYLWYIVPLSMVLGAVLLQQLIYSPGKMLTNTVLTLIFAGSYLVWPVWDTKTIIKDESAADGMDKWLWVSGMKSFAANEENGRNTPVWAKLAFLSGLQYYHAPHQLTHQELLKEIRRYGVDCYIYLGSNADEYQFRDESGQPFPVELEAKGFRAFRITPR